MFQTTQWSLVLRAREDNPQARQALEQLCRAYRAPVLAYVRRHVHAAEDAEDLTQGFFLKFLDRRDHAAADSTRGRFRSFLLNAVKFYLSNERDRATSAKRGGGKAQSRLDDVDERRLATAAEDSPESAFERSWALTVLARATERLAEDAARSGRAELFDRLRPYLAETPSEDDYARISAELGVRRNTLAVAVHRLRQGLVRMVRTELKQTVAEEADLEDELRTLRRSLGKAY